MWNPGRVHPEYCSTCGAEARPLPRPGVIERARAWFVHGDRSQGDRYECENGHGWTSATMRAVAGRRRRRVKELWRRVAFNRRVIPTPQSYAMAGLVGLVVGLVLGVVVGVPWWPLPLLFVVAAWIAATATAFRGPQRRETFEGIRDWWDPGGVLARHDARRRAELMAATFPIVGFADHPDGPWLGGTGRRDHELTSITVAYGDPLSGDERDEVTASVRDEPIEFARHQAADELRFQAAVQRGGQPDPAVLSLDVEWSPIDLVVDDETVPAQVAVVSGRAAIVADAATCRVVVWTDASEMGRRVRSLDPDEIGDPPRR